MSPSPLSEPTLGIDALQALRQGTSERHRQLDSAMPLARDNAGWHDYLAHLRLLHAWAAPLERWLQRFNDGPQGPDAPPALWQSPLMAMDLRQAGQALPPDQIGSPYPDDAAWRWGASYVLEGSRLGGAVLHKRLADRLPRPLYFLQPPEGPEVGPGPRWQHFLRALRNHLGDAEAISRACVGAQDSFDRLLALLPQAPRRAKT